MQCLKDTYSKTSDLGHLTCAWDALCPDGLMATLFHVLNRPGILQMHIYYTEQVLAVLTVLDSRCL